jgi:poly-gamma-glutamate capsule biosynthesis protein CapA/YwtB (metallophosphatase superfamily)
MTRATTMAFIGDLIFDKRCSAAAEAGRPQDVWGDVLPLLRGVDAVIANLEVPLTNWPQRWQRTFKPVRLRAVPAAVNLLSAANIAFVNFANNHTLDREVEGLAETLRLLDGAGIARAGAGLDGEEAARPALFQVAGTTIGAIGLTDNTPAFAAGPGRPGSNHMRIDDDAETMGRIAAQVHGLRAAGARTVILSAHWGPNLRPWPPARFRRFARGAIDRGVDVFHGHSAHIVQGVERRGDGVILYDTGDFIDDVWWFPFLPFFTGGVFLVDFLDGKVNGLRVVPVVLHPSRVRLARGAFHRRMISRLARLSPPGGRTEHARANAAHFTVEPAGATASEA